MKRIAWFLENLFGSAWRPIDYSTEFQREAAREGYLYARVMSLFRGERVRR